MLSAAPPVARQRYSLCSSAGRRRLRGLQVSPGDGTPLPLCRSYRRKLQIAPSTNNTKLPHLTYFLEALYPDIRSVNSICTKEIG